MPSTPTDTAETPELDVRPLRKRDKHPRIFATYETLPVGGSFVLINDHDPQHLREEFEAGHAGSYAWEYLNTEVRDWRIRIGKLASTPLPRVLVNTAELVADPADADAAGAVWKLQVAERDLDSNVIALPPGGTIDAHTGPDLDVVIHVIAGDGRLTTEVDVVALTAGDLVWLPRRSRRQFSAGPDGLRYLTLHRRRQSLVIDTSRLAAER